MHLRQLAVSASAAFACERYRTYAYIIQYSIRRQSPNAAKLKYSDKWVDIIVAEKHVTTGAVL